MDDGVLGMAVGGRRFLIIPALLAYGSQGIEGHVPPDSVIHLEMTIETLKPSNKEEAKPILHNLLAEPPTLIPSDSFISIGPQISIRSEYERGVNSPLNHSMEGHADTDRQASEHSISPRASAARHDSQSSGLDPSSNRGSFADRTGMSGLDAGTPRELLQNEGGDDDFPSLLGDAVSSSEIPTFYHGSTCQLIKRDDDGKIVPLELPGYGPDKSLGYVILQNKDGARRLVVYAPVFQADIGTKKVAANESAGLDFAYTVEDDKGDHFLMTLKGEGAANRFSAHIEHAKVANALGGDTSLSVTPTGTPLPRGTKPKTSPQVM
mmetsp:Transcript_8072/g.20055  ORF Transcript_8072/g.20055 Transcript_8072/m.20055 type:complete len:322 (+) Transcript_8072:3-968(+)